MEIKRVDTQASTKGPAEWLTGTVRIGPLFEAPEPARVRGASVTFEPGARTCLAYTFTRSNVGRDFRTRLGGARLRQSYGAAGRIAERVEALQAECRNMERSIR
jgi:hypothetical protein